MELLWSLPLLVGSVHPGGHPAGSAFDTVLASDDLHVCEWGHVLRDNGLRLKARNVETLHALAHFAHQQGSGVRTSSYVSGLASEVLYVCERKRVQLRKDDGFRPKARNVETLHALAPLAHQSASGVRTDSYEASDVETLPALAPLTRQPGSGVHPDYICAAAAGAAAALVAIIRFETNLCGRLRRRRLSFLDYISTVWAEVEALETAQNEAALAAQSDGAPRNMFAAHLKSTARGAARQAAVDQAAAQAAAAAQEQGEPVRAPARAALPCGAPAQPQVLAAARPCMAAAGKGGPAPPAGSSAPGAAADARAGRRAMGIDTYPH